MTAPVRVYNQNLQLVAVLQNAHKVGYEMPLNNLWKASFSLPANDPKNSECKPLYYVEIFDGSERIDLFRIVPHSAKRDSSGQTITYQCEHVLATLLDDVMFQFHTIGNLGVYTRDVLDEVLKHIAPEPGSKLEEIQAARLAVKEQYPKPEGETDAE